MPNISVTTSAHPKNKEITLLSVKGFIDTTTAPEFEKAFQLALSEKKFNLIVDLKNVNYVSSAGWGIFIGELKRIRSQKGNVYLASMSPEVTDAFELLEFDTILKSFPDVEQAVQYGFKEAPLTQVMEKPKKGKVLAKPPVKKNPEQSLPEAVVENPASKDIAFTEPQGNTNGKKNHWLGRLFQPWKWF
jgi:anti-sigma B factor antagonist